QRRVEPHGRLHVLLEPEMLGDFGHDDPLSHLRCMMPKGGCHRGGGAPLCIVDERPVKSTCRIAFVIGLASRNVATCAQGESRWRLAAYPHRRWHHMPVGWTSARSAADPAGSAACDPLRNSTLRRRIEIVVCGAPAGDHCQPARPEN